MCVWAHLDIEHQRRRSLSRSERRMFHVWCSLPGMTRCHCSSDRSGGLVPLLDHSCPPLWLLHSLRHTYARRTYMYMYMCMVYVLVKVLHTCTHTNTLQELSGRVNSYNSFIYLIINEIANFIKHVHCTCTCMCF